VSAASSAAAPSALGLFTVPSRASGLLEKENQRPCWAGTPFAIPREVSRPIVLTHHAREALARRGLTEGEVRAVVDSAEQVVPLRPWRVLMQSLQRQSTGQVYLLRVVVDEQPVTREVATAYRANQVARYSQGER
jgi:hypothetical protein